MQNKESQNNIINKQDKYKAIWMSHSGMGDYEKCPRLYYLHNIYKNNENKKINIVSPYMSLGIAVHNVVENLRNFKINPAGEKLILLDESRGEKIKNLEKDFDIEWEKYQGKAGGFRSEEERGEFKSRGVNMIKNIISDPKMLLSKTIPLTSYYDGDMLPNFYISPEENIILCGNLDWIEYTENPDPTKKGYLNVIDFKTGKNEEKENSAQLPIYKLLLEELQKKWKVKNGKYWYFESGEVIEKEISEDKIKEVTEKIVKIGTEIRDSRYKWLEGDEYKKYKKSFDKKNAGWVEKENFIDNFKCIREHADNLENKKEENRFECDCKKYEKIISGDPGAEYIGVDMYGKDSYFLNY